MAASDVGARARRVMSDRNAQTVRHPALEAAPAAASDSGRLSDRARVAVLLQAASLLAYLDGAGWRLDNGWGGHSVDAEGVLRGVKARRGKSPELPQASLRELAGFLFRSRERVAGRGAGRSAARAVLERWNDALARIPPDHLVVHLLEEAPFLWRPEHASARRGMAAEVVRDGRAEPWVAGPAWFCSAVLSRARGCQDAAAILASPEAEAIWRRSKPDLDPRALAARGRWRAAVDCWQESPPTKPPERLDYARSLYALGRFEDAVQALRRLRTLEARVLRAASLCWLGRQSAARRELGMLEKRSMEGDLMLDATAVAVRVYGNAGEFSVAERWVERALAATSGALRIRAELHAAAAAWDRGDSNAVDRHLGSAAGAGGNPELAWRWHKVKGWRAMDRDDGQDVVYHFSRALALRRRALYPFEAASLWNELAVGRAMVGDLKAAERGFRHAVRLHRDTQGARRVTLTLFNLAEIRLRRGNLAGVLEILERSRAENRRDGNRRGAVHDVALEARFDLVRGRPGSALARLELCCDELERDGIAWHRGELEALAARALGWLERGEEAYAALLKAGAAAQSQFEPEERPALWALAGARDRARQEIAAGPAEALWQAVLTDKEAVAADWSALGELEEFRQARLVLDIELIRPGFCPPERLKRAAGLFRRLGADAFAARLDRGDRRPWRALERFLEGGEPSESALGSLFAAAGFPEVRLVWRTDRHESILHEGYGGGEQVTVALNGGELVLEAPSQDPVLRSLFLIIAERVRTPEVEAPTKAAPLKGIVGEAPVFCEALTRAAKLAPTNVPVLVLGETGVGKELMARRLHQLSARAAAPFVPINCAAVSKDLLMSDLFGHVRGAFTGADRDRVGVFEAARGGTVFLDEIGDLPLEAQGFLLRVLQEGEVRRVGESLPRDVDVRVVAATHRDLAARVRDGQFREDLFFRLKVAEVELPPLRERGDDVLLLAAHFLNKLRPGETLRISSSARSRLLAHDWPGNVRELENVLSVAAALTEGPEVRGRDLELPCGDAKTSDRVDDRVGYHELVLDYRRRLVRQALEAAGGNRAEAARRLDLSRQALSYLVRKLEIDL